MFATSKSSILRLFTATDKFIEKKVEAPKRKHEQRIKREQPVKIHVSDSSDLDTSDSEGFDAEISTPDSSSSDSSSSDSYCTCSDDCSSSDSYCTCSDDCSSSDSDSFIFEYRRRAKRRKLTPTIWSAQLGYLVTHK
ncbi:hypothetical protein TNCV_4144251 [Trichonephila clavipes]|nr:hypothetical protein TNCV_4144251 [Trichonephila clavipes]